MSQQALSDLVILALLSAALAWVAWATRRIAAPPTGDEPSCPPISPAALRSLLQRVNAEAPEHPDRQSW